MLPNHQGLNSGRVLRLPIACILLAALASSGCSSDGGHAGAATAGAGGTSAGSGGTSASSAGKSNAGGASGHAGTAGAAGNSAGDAGTVTLHQTWSTWQLSGTTLTPVTCPMLGADTIGFSYNGATLETQENSYEENGEACAAGEEDVAWPAAPGDFSLTYGLYPNTFDTQEAIVSTTVPFTITPTSTIVEVAGKMIFARYPITWTIQKAGAAATCADVGATTVNIVLDQGDSTFSITTTFPASCAPGTFNSPPIQPGTYRVGAQLMSDDVQLASWTAPAPLVITADSAPALPAIVFALP